MSLFFTGQDGVEQQEDWSGLPEQCKLGTRAFKLLCSHILWLLRNSPVEINISLDPSSENPVDCLCLKHVFSCYFTKEGWGTVVLLGTLEIRPLEYQITLHLEP